MCGHATLAAAHILYKQTMFADIKMRHFAKKNKVLFLSASILICFFIIRIKYK